MQVRWWWLAFFILLVQVPVWFSLGDHPIHGRSEGRYAVVARNMVDHGNWLVPELDGHPHLTKPPLAYWLMAASMRALGTNEFAARLPSAAAGSLTLLLVMGVGWRERGRMVGLAAASVLCMFPLFFAVSRLALTDSLLSFAWTGVLVCGYLTVVARTPARRGWSVAALWALVAIGWMIKGPLALLPVAVLIVWLALAKNTQGLRRLRLPVGLLITLVPVAVWARAILEIHPDAAAMWFDQSFGRVVNGSDHPKPFWYFLPIFLAGMFPATAMMLLPGINHRWGSVWQTLRRGNGTSLWIVAIVLPLLVFSISSGKLATYILPVCPPMALLAGHVVVRWMRGVYERQHSIRGPLVPVAYYIALAGGLVVSVGIVVMHPDIRSMAALVVAGIALAVGVALWSAWRTQPTWRPVCAGLVVVVWCMAISVGYELEDSVSNERSVPKLREQIQAMVGSAEPHVYYAGIGDTSLEFYLRDSHRIDRTSDLGNVIPADDPAAVGLAQRDTWLRATQKDHTLAEQFTPAMYWSSGFMSDEWIVIRRTLPRMTEGHANVNKRVM